MRSRTVAALLVVAALAGGLAGYALRGGPGAAPAAPQGAADAGAARAGSADAATSRPRARAGEAPRSDEGPGPEDRGIDAPAATLDPEAPVPLAGLVVDAAGAPVAGADVRVTPVFRLEEVRDASDLLARSRDGPPSVDEARSGADGRFRLTRTPPGAFHVTAERQGSARGTTRVVLLPGAVPPEIRVTLAAGHALAGRVVRTDGGAVGGVRVNAVPDVTGTLSAPWDHVLPPLRTTTDASGAFRLAGLAAGRWSLVALADGELSSAELTARVPEDGAVAITLGGDARLAGRVTGPSGAPVAGARVLVTTAHDDRSAMVETGADGAYAIGGIRSGTTVFVAVEARGLAPSADLADESAEGMGALVRIAPGENRFDVALAAGGTLRGRVVAAGDGAAIEGVRVRLRGSGFLAMLGGAAAVTDSEGRFEFAGLRGGAYRARLERSGWHAVGDDAADGSVFAAILDRRGREAPETDPGEGLDVVVADGAVVERTLEMERAAVVVGRVVGPDGAGVPGARVRLEPADRDAARDELAEVFRPALGGVDDGVRATGATGAFELNAPPGRAFRVAAQADSFVGGTSDEITGAAGARLEGVVVALTAGGAVEGVVTGPDGAPVAGAEVWCARPGALPSEAFLPLSALQSPDATTGADGRYRVAPVPPGEARLTVRRDGFRTATQVRVDVAEGRTATADVALDRGCAVAGHVLDEAGRPVAGARVRCVRIPDEAADRLVVLAHRRDDASGAATTGDDGAFRVAGLMPGRYRVRATAAGRVPSAVVEAVGDGASVVVRSERALSIAGVVRCEGRPAEGVEVTATREDGGAAEGAGDDDAFDFPDDDAGGADSAESAPEPVATTGPDGAFEIGGLAPGAWRVAAASGDGPGGASVLRTTVRGIAAGARDVAIDCRAGLVLAGTVTRADGTPADEGTVEVTRADAASGSDHDAERDADPSAGDDDETRWADVEGSAFRVVGLRPGRYRLTVDLDDAGTATVTAGAGRTDLAIRVAPGGTVAGRVLGATAGAFATLRRADAGADDGSGDGDVYAMLGARGEVAFRNVPEGAWVLVVERTSKGRRWLARADVIVRMRQTTTVPDLTLVDVGPAAPDDGEEEE